MNRKSVRLSKNQDHIFQRMMGMRIHGNGVAKQQTFDVFMIY